MATLYPPPDTEDNAFGAMLESGRISGLEYEDDFFAWQKVADLAKDLKTAVAQVQADLKLFMSDKNEIIAKHERLQTTFDKMNLCSIFENADSNFSNMGETEVHPSLEGLESGSRVFGLMLDRGKSGGLVKETQNYGTDGFQNVKIDEGEERFLSHKEFAAGLQLDLEMLYTNKNKICQKLEDLKNVIREICFSKWMRNVKLRRGANIQELAGELTHVQDTKVDNSEETIDEENSVRQLVKEIKWVDLTLGKFRVCLFHLWEMEKQVYASNTSDMLVMVKELQLRLDELEGAFCKLNKAALELKGKKMKGMIEEDAKMEIRAKDVPEGFKRKKVGWILLGAASVGALIAAAHRFTRKK